MRKLQAFRMKLTEPVAWRLRHDKKAVFHKIEEVGLVITPDGEMLCVRIRQKTDFADPGTNIAVLVAKIPLLKASGKLDPHSPELWYYNDKFWVKAIDSQRLPYYNNKQYLLYEITVKDSDELMASLDHGYDPSSVDVL
jgi:hypothetical protein